MELQIDLLKTFLAIIDTGGFTNASQVVHRTQSAISMQVKRLEDMIGQPLFERIGRSIKLTTEGEALLPYARRLLKLHEETVAAMARPDVVGSVRIGIIDDYALRFLPDILSRFAKTYPRVQVTVRCEPTSLLVPALEKGELDLALINGTNKDGEVIRHDQAVWVTSASHLIHEEDPLPLAVFHDECIFRKWSLEALDSINRRYRVAYQSPSVAGIIATVSTGLAVSILFGSIAPQEFRVLRKEDGFPSLPEAKIVLKRSPGRNSEAVACMSQHIREGMR
ncbi:MAG: LysR family transcriptional regulator [Deltaproteobacteria bacterium]|jgi:DNA-binding transcriptional LysR family regulator|nr:LysR family transcriptional regulator [Deltaproteobacteria bacterium]MBW2512344.1 LysR family transcriptional regulator [Deltaproteobacteria bacterium]MDH4007078.1 LysR substrate-binding domain-containing protein [Desulfuromonadales bacterium]